MPRGIPYKGRLIQTEGNVRTYFEDSSNAARRSGLTVANMVASIAAGTGISVQAQEFTPANNELKFQLSFNEPGTSVVSITTTFENSRETIVQNYEAVCLNHHGRRFGTYTQDYR